MNPVIALEIADTLRAAVNILSLILLVPLGAGVAYAMVRAIAIALENQED